MKTNSQTSPEPPKLGAIIVQQGKLLDFVDGVTQRNETPEEYVRQEIAKSIVRENNTKSKRGFLTPKRSVNSTAMSRLA